MLVPADPVHARDGLQQVVLAQPLVDVHYLLDRGVEAREQHVADDEKGDAREHLVGVLKIEGLAEVGDRIPTTGLLARHGDRRRLVGRVGRDHHDGLEERPSANQRSIGTGCDLLLVDSLAQRGTDGPLVADGGELGEEGAFDVEVFAHGAGRLCCLLSQRSRCQRAHDRYSRRRPSRSLASQMRRSAASWALLKPLAVRRWRSLR